LAILPGRATTPLHIGAPLDVIHVAGLTPYLSMWDRQRELAAARKRNEIRDVLLLLEHAHVYTNGRSGRREDLLIDEAAQARLRVSYLEVDRGGRITYHGPGQLVGYAIVDLARLGLGVRTYVRRVEQVLVRTAAHFGVEATTVPGLTGVWVADGKLAAIGVKVSQTVTYHGFAINVDPDMSYFDHIVPCGIHGRSVTSLARLLGRAVAVAEVVPVCAAAFADVFGVELHWRERGTPLSDDLGCSLGGTGRG